MVNYGTDQPNIDTTTSKYGLHLAATAGMVTAGVYGGASGGSYEAGVYFKAGSINSYLMRLGSTFAIASNGSIGIGALPTVGNMIEITADHTGNTISIGAQVAGEIQSDVTAEYNGFQSYPAIVNAAFSLPYVYHFRAKQGTFTGGARTPPTVQHGFYAGQSLTGATNNYGFFSALDAAPGAWSFYGGGGAAALFSGNVIIGPGQLANNATDGFLYVSTTTSGAPTGTPTSYADRVPIVVDDTNLRIYVRIGGVWRYAQLV